MYIIRIIEKQKLIFITFLKKQRLNNSIPKLKTENQSSSYSSEQY